VLRPPDDLHRLADARRIGLWELTSVVLPCWRSKRLPTPHLTFQQFEDFCFQRRQSEREKPDV
jgi:hypothetical protein